jgi:hypothetical protein
LTTDPTKITYSGFIKAYDYFNERLFDNRLPRCLITMQRRSGANGYFANKRFGTRDATEITDEIALNPRTLSSEIPRKYFRRWCMRCVIWNNIISAILAHLR